MKFQPNRDYKSNDEVMTLLKMAERIVKHFNPTGKILEPCCGDGSFLRFLNGADWCEITKGRDFMEVKKHYEWIVTNPPWSKIKDFLKKSFEVADNVVFLMTVNHAFTKARIRIMQDMGFGIKEIMLLDMPKEFPQSGFQLGAIHYQKGYDGSCEITKEEVKE